MLSIQNTYSEEELADWHRQVTEKIPPDELELRGGAQDRRRGHEPGL